MKSSCCSHIHLAITHLPKHSLIHPNIHTLATIFTHSPLHSDHNTHHNIHAFKLKIHKFKHSTYHPTFQHTIQTITSFRATASLMGQLGCLEPAKGWDSNCQVNPPIPRGPIAGRRRPLSACQAVACCATAGDTTVGSPAARSQGPRAKLCCCWSLSECGASTNQRSSWAVVTWRWAPPGPCDRGWEHTVP